MPVPHHGFLPQNHAYKGAIGHKEENLALLCGVQFNK
ncbi:hypothetical protein PS838_04542 [Pseudomonas fluorescens]|nr:hypothetical protein PS838_04542 [Pseudomonas fluorescens]